MLGGWVRSRPREREVRSLRVGCGSLKLVARLQVGCGGSLMIVSWRERERGGMAVVELVVAIGSWRWWVRWVNGDDGWGEWLGWEREKGIGIFSKFFFTELERRKRGYFTLNFKNVFVLTIIFNTKHPKIETILKKKKKNQSNQTEPWKGKYFSKTLDLNRVTDFRGRNFFLLYFFFEKNFFLLR